MNNKEFKKERNDIRIFKGMEVKSCNILLDNNENLMSLLDCIPDELYVMNKLQMFADQLVMKGLNELGVTESDTSELNCAIEIDGMYTKDNAEDIVLCIDVKYSNHIAKILGLDINKIRNPIEPLLVLYESIKSRDELILLTIKFLVGISLKGAKEGDIKMLEVYTLHGLDMNNQ